MGGKDGGRAVGENKALSASKRFMPYASKCGVCKQSLHQQGIFCQTCAYSKGARPARGRERMLALRLRAQQAQVAAWR